MKRGLLLLAAIAAVLPMAGCGSSGDNYDPNKIAVKQEGSGPPPMTPPGAPPGGPTGNGAPSGK